jgi:hypothetical protein
MPQLDFFIFVHIATQTALIFFVLSFIIWNRYFIKIFRALKTRHLLYKHLEIVYTEKAPLEDTLVDVQKEIDTHKKLQKLND